VSVGLVSVFGHAFDHHVERIKRIVEEELPGCSASFDQAAWPIVRFSVENAHGATVSRMCSNFSMAELNKMNDRKLRSVIRRRCEPLENELRPALNNSGLNSQEAIPQETSPIIQGLGWRR
jgi:hypothetical protein